ncbi:ABC transporter substrate-binding protein [Rhizobium sp. 9140]|uniref:ABC transporter substrate-binding protein n=1 Tax=Rhizobium sp. 9140 TaxID=1761900 RepID=UPI002477D9F1|nr:ABC transporter substrate-binding protein [Rhizobium sp. 9140]
MGFVSPQTGAMGSFGETDAYALDFVRKHIGAGLDIRGTTYAVEVIERDSQSNANRAAEVAGELILNEEVQIIIPASTTDVTLPVSEQAELNGVPSVSSTAPWQAVIMPRGGEAFEWTYHFFWSLEDIIASFVNMWSSAETNKKVGLLLPRNTDGEVWGSEEFGLPPALRAAGLEVVKPSLFEPRTNDFSAQIAAFKSAGCDILGGLVFPGDLRTAAIQCAQQGFKPKIATLTLLDRKRLELARAMAGKPKLLLLDEIAGGLTDGEAKDLVTLIARLRDRGVTIIWIEHVLHAIMAVADRMMVLSFGEKIAEGKPDAVMRDAEVRRVYMGIEA